MGWAARANPRAWTPGKNDQHVALNRLARFVRRHCKTPNQLWDVVAQVGETEAERDAVFKMMKPFCRFDPVAMREEDAQQAERDRIAAATAGLSIESRGELRPVQEASD